MTLAELLALLPDNVTGDIGADDLRTITTDLYNAAHATTDATALAAHLADTVAAHAASAVSFTPAGTIAATDVQAALAEVASDGAAALAAHLAVASDAHDASAISFVPTGTIAATTVQAAIAEVAAEATGGGSGIADGDKGDVTVSGGGSVWTIDAGAVDASKVAADIATQAELDAVALAAPLLAGRAAGQTLIGSTASGGSLTLAATSHATQGNIQTNSGIRAYVTGATFTARPNSPFVIASAYVLDFVMRNMGGNNGNQHGLFHAGPQLTAAQAFTGTGSVGLKVATTMVNSGAIGNMGSIAAVRSVPTTTATGSAIVLGSQADFYSAPTFATAAGGTLSTGADYVHYETLLTGDGGVTVAQWAGLAVLPNVGALIGVETGVRIGNLARGSISVYGVDIGAGAGAWGGAGVNRAINIDPPTGGTENTGIYNGGTLRQVAPAGFGAPVSEPVYGIQLNAASGDAGAIHLKKQTSAPATPPASSAGVLIYTRGDAIVFEYNDAGTVRYKSLLLSGTGVTWVQGTVSP